MLSYCRLWELSWSIKSEFDLIMILPLNNDVGFRYRLQHDLSWFFHRSIHQPCQVLLQKCLVLLMVFYHNNEMLRGCQLDTLYFDLCGRSKLLAHQNLQHRQFLHVYSHLHKILKQEPLESILVRNKDAIFKISDQWFNVYSVICESQLYLFSPVLPSY